MPARNRPVCRAWIGLALILGVLRCGAAPAQMLDEVVVSVNRIEQKAFDTPASVNVIGTSQIQDGQPQINISEPLARVPGIFALNRQNYAQDLLISSRGFGANSTFGARGLKIFVDGIPGTVADGQGQISHIDLPSAERIEVLRGPFSAMYGNSAGGVINVFSESGKPGFSVTPYAQNGSYNTSKYGIKLSGEQGPVNYIGDAGQFHTGGFRQHSGADRQNENAKLVFALAPDTTATLVANNVALTAQDPLGLTTAQLARDARLPGTNALTMNTRKTVDQTQGGINLSQRLGADNSLAFAGYYGHRHILQFLAAAGNGGVIDLGRDYYGGDFKWLNKGSVAGKPYNLVAGFEANQLEDDRRTHTNALGVVRVAANDPKLDNGAKNFDQYVQGELFATDHLSFSAGVRHSHTTLSSADLVTRANSPGSNSYDATTGLASALYTVAANTNLYLSYGTGFDTPTLNQIANSTPFVVNGGVNTGNIALRAARTRQWETGLKTQGERGQASIALFQAETTDEVVVAASVAGKNSFTNAPLTRRTGVELSGVWLVSENLRASAALTAIDARVARDYSNVIGAAIIPIRSGNIIPGIPAQSLFTEVLWRASDKSWETAVEGRAAAKMYAADVNGTSNAGGYGVVATRLGLTQRTGQWTLTEFARIDNLFDRPYIGSVIVNQGAQQYYEAAPGRAWMIGVKATVQF